MKRRFLAIFSLILIMAMVFTLPSCKKDTQASNGNDTEVSDVNNNDANNAGDTAQSGNDSENSNDDGNI